MVMLQMFVFYPLEDKVGVKTIKTFAERMKSEGVSRAMMVVQANLTPFAKQCLTEMQPKYYIEVVSTLDPLHHWPCVLPHLMPAAVPRS